MSTLKYKIKVMKAARKGAKIEVGNDSSYWVHVCSPLWDWVSREYRIKQEVKWFDNIPPNGVLCWSEWKGETLIEVIVGYKSNYKLKFENDNGYGRSNATPLTDKELDDFKIGFSQ